MAGDSSLHASAGGCILVFLQLFLSLSYTLSYLVLIVRLPKPSVLLRQDTLPRSACLSLLSLGFLACTIIFDLAGEEHVEFSDGAILSVIRKCSNLVACIPMGHSLIIDHFRTARLLYCLCMSLILLVKCLEFPVFGKNLPRWSIACYATTFLWDILPSSHLAGQQDHEVWNTAQFFDLVLFSWLNPIVKRGASQYLGHDDLPCAPASIVPSLDSVSRPLNHKHAVPHEIPGFWNLLLRNCHQEYFLSFCCELLGILCKFVLPWVLRWFLNDMRASAAAIFFLITTLDTIATTQAAFQLLKAGAKMKAFLVCRIHSKLLTLPLDRDATGVSIVNLVEADTQFIQDFIKYVHTTWSAPLQIVACLASIGAILGWASAVAALLAMVLFLPIMHILNLLQYKYQMAYMKKRDIRMSIITQFINKIKEVKAMGLVELMNLKADDARLNELAIGTKAAYVNALINVILRTAPTLASVATYTVASAIGIDLNPGTLFSSLLLFGMLVYPLSMLPAVVLYWAGSRVSFGRLREFLAQPGLSPPPEASQSHASTNVPINVEFRDVSYIWKYKDDSRGDGLLSTNLSIKDKSLVTLDGDIGTGKSTFLQLCLGAIIKHTGKIDVNGRLAYLPQISWLVAGTVRDNILFGRPYDEVPYNKVIRSCALDHDLRDLSTGDQSEIDTVGSGLSGGQKSRIMLARTIYADADIYLLDDPLAALDNKMKAFIVANVLGPQGILKDKLRIVTSSGLYLTELADLVLNISNSHIMQASPKLINGRACRSKDHQPQQNVHLNEAHIEDDSSETTIAQSDVNPSNDNVITLNSQDSSLIPNTPSQTTKADFEPQNLFGNPALYRRFFRYGGGGAWAAVGFIILASYAANVLSTYMLKLVGSSPRGEINRLMVLYAFCCTLQALFIFLWLIFAWYLCNRPTSYRIYKDLVRAILAAPMRFFRLIQIGEILNRFTNDLSRLDSPIFALVYGLLNASVRTISTILVISAASPVSFLYTFPVLILLWMLQRSYVRVAVQLRKLENTSRGPVLTAIGEAEAGLCVIRSMGQSEKFKSTLHDRVLKNMTVYFSSIGLEQWLVFRTGMVSAFIAGVCPMVLIYLDTDSSLVGLVMNFVLQLSSSLAITAVVSTQLESEMVSFQRLIEYCDIKSEEATEKPRVFPPASWPARGEIEFNNVSATYDPEAPPVLENLTFTITSGQKIGIVGRSGAGKSSIILTLLGLLETNSGCIQIDDLDLSDISLDVLRQRITTITQEPTAFLGTVRHNLDPYNAFDTEDLIKAIEESTFSSGFPNPYAALEFELTDRGQNPSTGQLQLLAVARALLHGSSILLLDEATASVDSVTKNTINDVIKKNFHDRTIITVAHRLNTILNSDQIIIMESGRIKEVGSPRHLYVSGGVFTELVDEGGLSIPFQN